MKITHFDKADSYEPDPSWKRVSLCAEEGISIEHFVKPPGHASPVHHHPSMQVIVVLKGKMRVTGENRSEDILEEGDSAVFFPDEPHSVINDTDSPAVGIDIFVPGRSFDFWLKRK